MNLPLLPTDEIMQQLTKLAVEQATAMFAKFAREFSKEPFMAGATGSEALIAFANAIENHNARLYPKPSAQA